MSYYSDNKEKVIIKQKEYYVKVKTKKWKEKHKNEMDNRVKVCSVCGKNFISKTSMDLYCEGCLNRKCKFCGGKIPFNSNKNIKQCGKCKSTYARLRKLISYSKYREKDPILWYKKRMLMSAKMRSKKKGLDFNLVIDDIIIPERCPILDIPLVVPIEKGKKTKNTPSLDRIDNSKGYIKGNVAVISDRANQKKNNSTIEELEKILKYMRNTKK